MKIQTSYEEDDKFYGLSEMVTGKKIKVQHIPFGMSGATEPIEDQPEEEEVKTSLTRRKREELERDFQIYADTGETDSAYIEDYKAINSGSSIPDLTKLFDKY